MTPPESEPSPENREEKSGHPPQAQAHTKWVLTTDAFNKLLETFSLNREEAGQRYELMRVRLVRFFGWRSCVSPEDLADETVNRVARKIEEGQAIANLSAYFLSVARLIAMESIRERGHASVPLDEIPEVAAEQPYTDEVKEVRLSCLDHCLNKLPVESRSLILGYHHDERRAKIDRRRQLAEDLGIPLNALRIRAHRIRVVLEKCVSECLAQPA